ncbi:MAG: hypothetical protein Q8K27_00855, partial [Betaproteobacteria bacterium]|nr:hypothetical protein [Betaproteobacteria bacterium]
MDAKGGRTWMRFDRHTAQQGAIRTNLTVQADQISDSLPELVSRLILPIYELFDFFTLPAQL